MRTLLLAAAIAIAGATAGFAGAPITPSYPDYSTYNELMSRPGFYGSYAYPSPEGRVSVRSTPRHRVSRHRASAHRARN